MDKNVVLIFIPEGEGVILGAAKMTSSLMSNYEFHFWWNHL